MTEVINAHVRTEAISDCNLLLGGKPPVAVALSVLSQERLTGDQVSTLRALAKQYQRPDRPELRDPEVPSTAALEYAAVFLNGTPRSDAAISILRREALTSEDSTSLREIADRYLDFVIVEKPIVPDPTRGQASLARVASAHAQSPSYMYARQEIPDWTFDRSDSFFNDPDKLLK